MTAEFYEDVILEETEETKKGFKVTDDNGAAWTLRKIETLRKREKFVSEGYKRRIEQLTQEINVIGQAWKKDAESINSDIEYFQGLIHEYLNTLDNDLFEDKKTQRNIVLAGRKIVVKKQGCKLIKEDEDKLLNYLKAYDNDYIKTKEHVDWSGFKKRLEAVNGKVIDRDTGAVVDGVSVEETPEELIIKE